MRSDRFYWCTGCGKWHDPHKGTGIHYAMCCKWAEPNERNFDGTPEELERFRLARLLKQEDADEFERRIDVRLQVQPKHLTTNAEATEKDSTTT